MCIRDSWCVPEIERVGESDWRFTPDSGRPPTFDPSVYWGVNADTDDGDSDSDAADNVETSLVTAKGNETYSSDWDQIESSASPALASARLLHEARRMTDVSRWWTLRWTNNAVSLLSRACSIGTGKSCKLFRKLRRITISYASELWLTIADRRHDTDDQIEKEAVKAKWLRLQRLLGRAVNKRGLCMPGCRWPIIKWRFATTVVKIGSS